MPMSASRWRACTALAALLAGVVGSTPSRAASAVSITDVIRDGSLLGITGQATFSTSPFVSLGTDPAADQLPPGGNALGKDVTGFSMAATPTGNLMLRWHLSQLPTGLDRGVDVSYGKAFCVSPATDLKCFAITFIDVAGAPLTNSFVWGWTCPDESCAISSGDHTHSWETDSYDAATKTANATVSLSDLGIAPGAELVPAHSPNFQGSSVWVTTPWWFNATSGAYPTYDGTAIDDAYRVPAKQVSLAIGAPGQAPEGVDYTSEATIEGANRFAGQLDVSSLAPGSYAVYARACFGDGNCAFTSRAVTV